MAIINVLWPYSKCICGAFKIKGWLEREWGQINGRVVLHMKACKLEVEAATVLRERNVPVSLSQQEEAKQQGRKHGLVDICRSIASQNGSGYTTISSSSSSSSSSSATLAEDVANGDLDPSHEPEVSHPSTDTAVEGHVASAADTTNCAVDDGGQRDKELSPSPEVRTVATEIGSEADVPEYTDSELRQLLRKQKTKGTLLQGILTCLFMEMSFKIPLAHRFCFVFCYWV